MHRLVQRVKPPCLNITSINTWSPNRVYRARTFANKQKVSLNYSHFVRTYNTKPNLEEEEVITFGDYVKELPSIMKVLNKSLDSKNVNINSEFSDLLQEEDYKQLMHDSDSLKAPLTQEMKDKFLKLKKLSSLLATNADIVKSSLSQEVELIDRLNEKILESILDEDYEYAEIAFMHSVTGEIIENSIKLPKPNVKTYLIMINLFKSQLKVKKVESILGLMEDEGIKPTIQCYNGLLDLYVSVGLYDHADNLYQKILSSGLEPNAKTYQCLIAMYSSDGKTEEAVKNFKLFRENFPDCTSTLAYGQIIEMLSNQGKTEILKDIIADFISRDIDEPDILSAMMVLDLGVDFDEEREKRTKAKSKSNKKATN